MITKNKRMANELQVAKQREEKSIGSTRVEMNMAILVEVSALETVTWRLYDRFVTVHKVVFHLNGH